jgi:ABC-2 type transport system ATP-binding protein
MEGLFMIRCKNVAFAYKKKGSTILKSINFEMKPHKITILLGNNGSGKTTLLNCIDGALEVSQGEILKACDCILISDQPYLYEYLTGREYLDVIATLKGIDSQEAIKGLIDDLEMEKDLDKLILDYSLGMKHKLSIIASLVLGYQLYLIDEPLAALDPDRQRFMINYFKKLRTEGFTFLISTHMMYVAYELADDILILQDGVIHQVDNHFETYEAFENYVLHQLRLKLEV